MSTIIPVSTPDSVETVRVIAGLGNPGSQYERTRHNIGFMLLDALGADCVSRGQQLSWKNWSTALVTEMQVGQDRVLLVKPLKFMNLSGEPIAEVLHYFQVAAQELLVLHDDADLPLGKLRIKVGGGDGGHNGVRSVCEKVGSSEFVRMKLGIGRPDLAPVAEDQTRTSTDISAWVLSRFTEEELKFVGQTLQRGVLAIEEICKSGVKTAQNRFNVNLEGN